MKKLNYLIFILFFTLFSCERNTTLDDIKKEREKIDNEIDKLGKQYGVNYLIDTVNIKYSVEGEKLIVSKALMLHSGEIQDLVKQNDSTYIIRFYNLYNYIIDIKTNEKQLIQRLLQNEEGCSDPLLIFKLEKLQKVAVSFYPLVTWSGDDSELSADERREYVEMESNESNLFYGKGKLIHLECL
ncbi:hypothetical protein ACE193_22540 [Bernardetia sp. OM2101]|uniref:hypothetical protein n=1 Tax=Bernardetia sp. OM2101 TaxID=3344876 RepID=UPI0035D073FE